MAAKFCVSQSVCASLTESIANPVGRSWASPWQYGSALQNTAVCLDVYDSAGQQHHTGGLLREDEAGPYFEANGVHSLLWDVGTLCGLAFKKVAS